MKKKVSVTLLIVSAALACAQPVTISGTIEWDTMKLDAAVSLNLAEQGIRLPAGRTQGEALIASEYIRLIRPAILNLQADSSSTVAGLIGRGEWSLLEAETAALNAAGIPPALSPDLRSLSAAYTLDLAGISAALIRHRRPAEVPRTLSPAASPAYTGIIIIANEALPVHGMKSAALPVPCLFPKIWDTGMNLIFERNMLETGPASPPVMVRYATAAGIFTDAPSGLSPEIAALAGSKPLRIFARGVFGTHPTDPIIDREDALQIISREENRRLLREGKVLIILDESVLKSELRGE